ncbi:MULTISPECIES: ATP synthase F0 subunit B [Streptomyces]|uniref:Cell division initiation protein n=1 Tax=Streptomyces albus (strain ATCC 21838 / DSM 41398 / FERM P-419 / JCM 4703 / NBRC 107858) TaxID=1081613 RepID=A0A0B5EKH8_STRA4|nr:ATP synthase F0 subunit B [Streptomyces sp. SCSIO ZS0520]AJE82039.1 hypothetical protein SLNWT_1663 [Streptomyces albus]AOU76357.1 hypothetical protein SLNHY_1666 [Streptomyces albus]AYN32142.1 cell division initiation protein [Streptomyces albus]
MDVQKKLDEIVDAVTGARSMPMSASCVVNRAELLAQLEEVRAALPGSLAQAQELIGDRDQMVAAARQEAERILASARAERGSLVSGTEIARHSQDEAERILAEARREAEEVRAEADDYVDSKLANFEVVLTKTLGSVGRGREKLLGAQPGGEQGYEDPDYAEAPERSQDPETLRQRADAYVDVKLGAFEAVLAKTLEAVGRGRQKLHGRVATDELGALAELGAEGGHTTDSDYLAGLAGPAAAPAAPAAPEPPAAVPPPPSPTPFAQPEQPSYAPAAQEAAAQTGAYAAQDPYGYQQQDPYGGYQQPYAQPDAYGYPQQQDPYAQGGYPPQPYPQDPLQGQDPLGQGYDPAAYDPQHGYPQSRHPQAPQEPTALDETSLFDTGMISAEQLRQYEQGR